MYYDTIPGLNREMGKLALEISHQTRLNAIAQPLLQNQWPWSRTRRWLPDAKSSEGFSLTWLPEPCWETCLEGNVVAFQSCTLSRLIFPDWGLRMSHSEITLSWVPVENCCALPKWPRTGSGGRVGKFLSRPLGAIVNPSLLQAGCLAWLKGIAPLTPATGLEAPEVALGLEIGDGDILPFWCCGDLDLRRGLPHGETGQDVLLRIWIPLQSTSN